jgi:hypothetical protein
MLRHGFRPSNDPRWSRIAADVIARAEREEVELPEFYAGLVAIMDEIDDRLSVGPSECEPADDEE